MLDRKLCFSLLAAIIVMALLAMDAFAGPRQRSIQSSCVGGSCAAPVSQSPVVNGFQYQPYTVYQSQPSITQTPGVTCTNGVCYSTQPVSVIESNPWGHTTWQKKGNNVVWHRKN